MGTVAVIGGGPAGMMAAGIAAANGAAVTLLERNEKLGKKLYITGKGRCNITNATDMDGLQRAVMSNARFMLSAFSAFGSTDLRAFLEENGVPLKVERGGRVFPVSDKASDITRAMEKFLQRNGVRIMCGQRVESVSAASPEAHGRINGMTETAGHHGAYKIKTERSEFLACAVIIATGGLSYPSTGSTGDGYDLARFFGHTVVPTYPSLVPINVSESWVADAAGLSLKNVRCDVFTGKKKPDYSEVGEMLFTPSGVTGPLILTASRYITDKLNGSAPQAPYISLDLKPALANEELDERIRRDFAESINKNFTNSLDKLLPQRLIGIILLLSGIEPERKVNAITKQERLRLVSLIKGLRLTPVSTAGYNEAVVTMGGVSVKEINPSTMMSKKAGGLFFAGEVLDVDALTGGYNLQAAFSTGYLAGKRAAEYAQ